MTCQTCNVSDPRTVAWCARCGASTGPPMTVEAQCPPDTLGAGVGWGIMIAMSAMGCLIIVGLSLSSS